VAKIRLGLADRIELGNIKAQRDWGYAPYHVKAMCLMLQHEKPEDCVIATGVLHTVEDFLRKAFDVVGFDYRNFLKINEAYLRLGEAILLCSDASKAKADLGWESTKSLSDIVEEMVLNDI